MNTKFLNFLLLGVIVLFTSCKKPPQVVELQLTADNIDEVIAAMTMEEKALLLRGSGMKALLNTGTAVGETDMYVPGAAGTTYPIPRFGIPPVVLSDGPAGLRINPTRKNDDNTYYCTAFPIGTLLASTWDVSLVKMVGEAMGNEVKEYGIGVILGPGANLHRNPLCGRNFEYYSEDPLITGKIGAAMVNGIQSNGVGTAVKHFVANNQETNRNNNNAIVSERALREIYYKGFEIIVKESQPWTIMTSYNKLNGPYTSENRELLTDMVRDEWGFSGLVMTDWFGGRNAPAQIHAGNDLLEPGRKKQSKAIIEAVENGTLSMEDVDVCVRRVLELVIRSGELNGNPVSNKPDLKAHAEVTRQSAAEGMVLLKNDNSALPLSGAKNLALFGVTSYNFIAGGTGSGDVNEAYTVSLEEGLANAGFELNTEAKEAFEAFKAENKKAFKKPKNSLSAMMKEYKPLEFIPSEELLKNCTASSDAAIITIGRNSGEGRDRVEKDDFLLTADEQEMIITVCDAFHAAGKKVIVVMNIGGVIETATWKTHPDAILLAWQGGQEGGNSVADILSGKVNPSGKLPMTFPVNLADHASTANFPLDGESMKWTSFLFGTRDKPEEKQVRNVDYTIYEEGIYLGYRHFDKHNIEVSFPFGYGLSYTSFEFENMDVKQDGDLVSVTVMIKNTGAVPGKEVAEIYLSLPGTTIDRPVQELKAFAKTPLLNPGESAELTMKIPVADFSYWNEESAAWTLENGIYTIKAGTSSRDIKLNKEIKL